MLRSLAITERPTESFQSERNLRKGRAVRRFLKWRETRNRVERRMMVRRLCRRDLYLRAAPTDQPITISQAILRAGFGIGESTELLKRPAEYCAGSNASRTGFPHAWQQPRLWQLRQGKQRTLWVRMHSWRSYSSYIFWRNRHQEGEQEARDHPGRPVAEERANPCRFWVNRKINVSFSPPPWLRPALKPLSTSIFLSPFGPVFLRLPVSLLLLAVPLSPDPSLRSLSLKSLAVISIYFSNGPKRHKGFCWFEAVLWEAARQKMAPIMMWRQDGFRFKKYVHILI